ncbi:hypothetical protein J4217_00675 [Candidatus Pacearchaeota archaeon]|nr:hypothetical protein [Candidatus Pacearchaeota archaeon]
MTKEENEIKNGTPTKAINFDNIPLLLEEKTKKISKKEAEIKSLIISRIKELGENLDKGINALRNVDLNKRKEEERLKLIVKENSNLYASLMLRLNSKLIEISENKGKNESSETETKIILEKIVENLNEFYRASITPFQKGTILIGKEMENLKMMIKEFSDEIILIERENEFFFKEYESINALHILFSELKDSKKQEESLILLLEEQKRKSSEIENNHEKIEKQIEDIKKSKDYEMDMKKRENKEIEKKEIERKIRELKMNIDFKELGKKYHSIEKMHWIIKKYSNNFALALIEDKEFEFERLLVDENQKELIKVLRNQSIELNKQFSTKSEEKIKSLGEEQKNIKNELETIMSGIDVINRRKDKLINRKDKLKEEIKYMASIDFK